MLNLSFVPLIAALQGFFAYQSWRAFGDDFTFYAKILLLALHLLTFTGWQCSQESRLGATFLPFKRNPGFEINPNGDENENENEDEDEDEEGKKLVDDDDNL